MILDLNNMPFGAGQIIKKMIESPRCTSDHVLILADALEEMANEFPENSHYAPAMRRNVAALREVAPAYAATTKKDATNVER